jgi:hypothetical protein
MEEYRGEGGMRRWKWWVERKKIVVGCLQKERREEGTKPNNKWLLSSKDRPAFDHMRTTPSSLAFFWLATPPIEFRTIWGTCTLHFGGS